MSAPAIAQKLGPDGAPNPTASVTSERDLFKQVPRAEGRIDIPDTKAAVLIQPAGRTWDYFHEVLLHWGGAIVILGMIVVLGVGLSDHGTDFGFRPGAPDRKFSASRPLSGSRIG